MALKDSGSTREFGTGGHRDSAEGKGRMDLIPWDVALSLDTLKADAVLRSIVYFLQHHDLQSIDAAIEHFVYLAYPPTNGQCSAGSMYMAMMEVSKLYEQGANKYGENNWQKGMPTHVYLDCALRHYMKWQTGWKDEAHDRAVIWNLLGLKWTVINKPELDDIPIKKIKEDDSNGENNNT